MPKIISVHSFRGGTGKSNSTANLATQLAMQGHRVGIVDTDIQSPGIHVLFGLQEEDMKNALNDYLWGKCKIQDTAVEVTDRVKDADEKPAKIKGKIFLIPSSIKAGEIVRILREGYDVGLLNDGFRALVKELDLDYLLIDTHPGVGEETLLSIAISDVLIIILRPDQQDFQGTAVTVDVARKLGVPKMLLLVNKVPEAFLQDDSLQKRVEGIYSCKVAALLPHSDEMMTLGSAGIFSVKFPNHLVSKLYKDVAAAIG